QAAELLQDPALGLRAGDALHLAVALHSRCSQLASFDIRMQQAATVLGLSPALS
ncbi:MAG: putative nucleic acid-binding protein, partial [Cyanobium sp.]